MKTGRALVSLGIFLGTILLCRSVQGGVYTQTYLGNATGNSTVVSEGTLTMSGNVGTDINVTFTRGGTDSATMNDYLVLFLDTTAGGFSSTASFTDRSSASRAAISGYNGNRRTVATFASGFAAEYAVVINPDIGAVLYQLGTDTHDQIYPVLRPQGNGTDRTYNFTLSRSTLNLASGGALRFQSGYSSAFGSRTQESFETLAWTGLWSDATYGYYNLFDVQAVPEMTSVALPAFGGLFVMCGIVGRVRRVRGAKTS